MRLIETWILRVVAGGRPAVVMLSPGLLIIVFGVAGAVAYAQPPGGVGGNMMGGALPDLYEIWDYSDPAGTRAAFEEILPHAESARDSGYLLELKTQIARTYSLEANFAEAHRILDEVEGELDGAPPVVRIRYLLERGRSFNSDNQQARALPLFVEAYELSKKESEDFHQVDAAHMVAIAASDSEEKERWNLTGIAVAGESENPRTRKWIGSLTNNIGWDYFSAERYADALGMFEKTLVFYVDDQPNQSRANIARWSIAKTERMLGNLDSALAIQEKLYAEYQKAGTPDGYVSEELAEINHTRGETEKARKFFAEAYRQLSGDTWLQRNEPERLERLRKLGGLPAPDSAGE